MDRYIPIEQSLADSCKEVNGIREEAENGCDWNELSALIDNLTFYKQNLS